MRHGLKEERFFSLLKNQFSYKSHLLKQAKPVKKDHVVLLSLLSMT